MGGSERFALLLQDGAEVDSGGRRFVIMQLIGFDLVVARNVETQELRRLAVVDLNPVGTPSSPTAVQPDLAGLDDNDWAEELERLPIAGLRSISGAEPSVPPPDLSEPPYSRIFATAPRLSGTRRAGSNASRGCRCRPSGQGRRSPGRRSPPALPAQKKQRRPATGRSRRPRSRRTPPTPSSSSCGCTARARRHPPHPSRRPQWQDDDRYLDRTKYKLLPNTGFRWSLNPSSARACLAFDAGVARVAAR
jgi:hypothetical protein